jgi:hypothetical protein
MVRYTGLHDALGVVGPVVPRLHDGGLPWDRRHAHVHGRVQHHVLPVHGRAVPRHHLRVHRADVALQELPHRAAAVQVGNDRGVRLPTIHSA